MKCSQKMEKVSLNVGHIMANLFVVIMIILICFVFYSWIRQDADLKACDLIQDECIKQECYGSSKYIPLNYKLVQLDKCFIVRMRDIINNG